MLNQILGILLQLLGAGFILSTFFVTLDQDVEIFLDLKGTLLIIWGLLISKEKF